PGTAGFATALVILIGVFLMSYGAKRFDRYNLDPQGRAGAFEPFLARYIRTAEFIVGLATGSIVLLVGSSALHGQTGHLPSTYTSPLLLLAFCVVYAIAFMVWLIFHYEDHQHGNPHTKL